MLSEWRKEQRGFHLTRGLAALRAKGPTFAERRLAVFEHPKVREGAAELFREVAKLVTQAALDAYQAWKSEAEEGAGTAR